MNIQITKDFGIRSDSLQFIVTKRQVVDPTKSPKWQEGMDSELVERWKDYRWTGQFQRALQIIADAEVLQSEATTVKELQADINRIYEEINGAIHYPEIERAE